MQLTVNQLVVGSIPASGANIGDVMELVYVLVLEAKFCEFESHRPHQFALLSLVAKVWFCNPGTAVRFCQGAPVFLGIV